MSLITEFMATEQLVKAIYLTLLHSLWQGAAIAGLAGIVMMLSKRSSSTSRYNFLAGSMAFFVLSAIVTFFKFVPALSDAAPAERSAVAVVNLSHNGVFTTPIDQLFSFLNLYSNRIVLLWFLIICLKSLQLYLGLQSVSNLKTKQTSDPGAKWINLVGTLSEKLGIHRSVKLLESGLTSVPLTVGYLKPIILVPLGILAAIPADQVEAILLHELAHIKRKDYFINIFQSVVEVLFFFNPAIWCLSSLIRAERENCCDDIAIANSSSKINYVRALISFEEYRSQHTQIAVAFTGSENTLLKRTRRIIYNQNNTLNSMEKFILTSGLVLSGLLSLAFTDDGKEQISKTFKPVVSTITETFPVTEKAFKALADTIPASSIREVSIINGGVTTLNAVHKGKTYKILMKDDEVTDLYINNVQVAKEKLGNYTEAMIEIFELSAAMKIAAEEEKKQAEQIRFAAIGEKDHLKSLDALNTATFEAIRTLSRLSALTAIGDTVTPRTPKAAPAAPKALGTPNVPQTPPAAPVPPVPPKAGSGAMKATPVKGTNGKVFKATPIIDAQPAVVPAVEIDINPVVNPAIHVAPKVEPAIEINETPAPVKIKPAAKVGSFQTKV